MFLLISIWVLAVPIRAQQCPATDYDCQISQIQKEIDALAPAQEKNKKDLSALRNQINSLNKRITDISAQLKNIESEIKQREEDLAFTYEVFDEKAKKHYAFIRFYDPIAPFLFSKNASEAFREISFRQRAIDEDRKTMEEYAGDLSELKNDKENLQKIQTSLAGARAALNKKADFLQGEVDKVGAYLASLSARQQQLLAEKLGSLNIPLFAYNTQGGCSSDIDPYKDPGFGGTKIGLFTYGVPNRVGLNQYGAWGRAKANQDADTILHAYYNFDGYQTMDATIKVNNGNGYNTGNVIWTGSLEDYVKRVWEVPDSWTDNNLAALKAQAIAVRSYVLAETDNGNKSICANTHCQVFQTNPKGGNWETAVNATSGQVMVSGGKPIAAYFSSTHGGYFYNTADIGWSATSFTKRGQDANGTISNFNDLQSKAYDKDSPWFYCDWGYRSQYNKTAWMTSAEMADIVNSILLVQNESSADPHILQTDKNYPDAWSEEKIRQELSKYRTPFTSISSGSVDVNFANGQTTSVHFSGNAGSVDFDGNVFKKYFNLRAPANIQIVGPLYNVEVR